VIVFKTIRWKNFLSTGNEFTEINLQRSVSTLVVGENGAGKSTMLDALSFALYGKAFRNINKPQLMNTITGKGLVAEVEFSIGKKNYMVRRGMKPHFFEILNEGVLLNQSSDIREYQEILETQILKLNHRSFSQIVVLGSANFVPFMQLPAAHRREVIEDLLDIQIFSTMNNILKDKIQTNKGAILDNNNDIKLLEQKIDLTKKHLATLQENNEELIAEKHSKILENIAVINDLVLDSSAVENQIVFAEEKVTDESKVRAKKKKFENVRSELTFKLNQINEHLNFFHNNSNCPTCTQQISDTFVGEFADSKKERIDQLTDGLQQLETEIAKVDERIDEIDELNSNIKKFKSELVTVNMKISMYAKNSEQLYAEKEALVNKSEKMSDEATDVNTYIGELKVQQEKKETLANERVLLEAASHLLKDGGIKTKIIKQYVPVINKLINKYLAAMDFFIQFELNDQFEETIKSRFRDEFSYASFSEGEKMRIDLALLFTWRAVAKLRNSASTNLLIMDEVFDSSLDSTGTDEFLKILQGLTSETNVFIISHKGDQLYDKFHSVIKFEKHKNFSRIAA
jgi:DNA repair exonuclease SbcCD ATPase subunit